MRTRKRPVRTRKRPVRLGPAPFKVRDVVVREAREKAILVSGRFFALSSRWIPRSALCKGSVAEVGDFGLLIVSGTFAEREGWVFV